MVLNTMGEGMEYLEMCWWEKVKLEGEVGQERGATPRGCCQGAMVLKERKVSICFASQKCSSCELVTQFEIFRVTGTLDGSKRFGGLMVGQKWAIEYLQVLSRKALKRLIYWTIEVIVRWSAGSTCVLDAVLNWCTPRTVVGVWMCADQ